jgi:hypothetical protein
MAATWLAKYTGGASNDWIATAQFQPSMGLLAASYWHKLSPQVDVAADLQLMAGPTRREALATTGIKWETRLATFRAQLDSTGKLSAMLEQRFASSLLFLLTGEIDHFKVRNPSSSYRYNTDTDTIQLLYSLECSQSWRRHPDRVEPNDGRYGNGITTANVNGWT